MKLEQIRKYKRYILAIIGVICLFLMAFFLWPSCSHHKPKVTGPSPTEEILNLRSELNDMALALDNLSAVNLKLMDENKVLRTMLVDCMQRHMED